jgi:hypothetical protein
MARNPRRLDAQLDELYACLPEIECKGFCSASCGPIGMSLRERQRAEGAGGRELPVIRKGLCPMLVDRRCSIYEVRPMTCRLWGLVDRMRCPYGCQPERLLTDEEGKQLLAQAEAIGGRDDARIRDLMRLLSDVAGGRVPARRLAR